MRKLLKRIAIIGVILFTGYTVSQSEFGQDVLLPRLAEFIPIEIEELQQGGDASHRSASSLPTASTKESTSPANPTAKEESIKGAAQVNPAPYLSPPESVDDQLIRSTILQMTNDLRSQQGVGSLVENERLEAAANTRAVEIAESFSHTRPSGQEFYTVLAEADVQYDYWLAGENLAMGTYHLDDARMAAFLFEGWVESQGHYENMIEPDFEELGIGVHYDGEYLYLVQTFGTSF